MVVTSTGARFKKLQPDFCGHGHSARVLACVIHVSPTQVHPAGTHFAVGERGVSPNVYIYEYPSMLLVRVLEGGTERAFSDLRFSNDGKMLATVSSSCAGVHF